MVFNIFKDAVSLHWICGWVCQFWYSNDYFSLGYGGFSIGSFAYDYDINPSHGVNIGHNGHILRLSEKLSITLKST